MKKHNNDNWVYLFFRMSVLFFALAIVIYSIKITKSSEFTAGVANFFGFIEQNPIVLVQQTNWCPNNYQRATLKPDNMNILNASKLESICTIKIQSMTVNEKRQFNFEKSLIVQGNLGQKELFFSSEHNYYNLDGLIFKSDELKDKLLKLFQE